MKASKMSWGRFYKMARVNRMPNYISDLKTVVGRKNPGHLVATSACLGSPLGDIIQVWNRWRKKKQMFIYHKEMGKFLLQPNQAKNKFYNNGLFFADHTATKCFFGCALSKDHSSASTHGRWNVRCRFYKYMIQKEIIFSPS